MRSESFRAEPQRRKERIKGVLVYSLIAIRIEDIQDISLIPQVPQFSSPPVPLMVLEAE